MDKIIKLDRRHMEELSIIDFESNHKNSSKLINRKNMKKEIKARFDNHNETFFGYKRNGELIGYITLKLFFPGYKYCELYWLAVKKKFQGQGVGKRLIRFI